MVYLLRIAYILESDMKSHIVLKHGLTEEHQIVFDKLAFGTDKDDLNASLVEDLMSKHLVELDPLNRPRIPLVVYSEWINKD